MQITATESHIESARGIEVQRTVALLRRYRFLEESCIRALAAAFLRTPKYEHKIALGYQLWAHAERVNDLRNRLHELRGGHHGANLEPALDRLGQLLFNAPDSASFTAAWVELLQWLAGAYAQHLSQADPAANAQEIRILHRLEPDVRRTLDVARSISSEQPELNQKWLTTFNEQLAAALNSTAESSANIFIAPASLDYVFDDRISIGKFDDYDTRMTRPFDERRIAELEIYFNEFYAAGLIATIIIDAAPDAPWEFLYDMSHHFWDEVRHAEFGLVRLRELGVEPYRVDLTLFHASRRMPFLHRLCYLTLGLEVYFMPRKRPRVRRYADSGDRRTQLFADVDWSDEGNHVQYGKKWVEHFLKDDARSVEDLQDEIDQYLKEAGVDLPEGQQAPY